MINSIWSEIFVQTKLLSNVMSSHIANVNLNDLFCWSKSSSSVQEDFIVFFFFLKYNKETLIRLFLVHININMSFRGIMYYNNNIVI